MRSLFFSLIFIAAAVITHAQIVIKGRVINSTTAAPVANASVYLNNTAVGTVTSSTGEFVLSTPNIYTAELIVSSIGYQPLSYKLNADSLDKVFFTFKLDIKESALNNVLVVNDATRMKWLRIFRENFLGITQEGDNCKIENAGAVYFGPGNNKNAFYAYADTPLVIINQLLGYKITFDLVEFSFDKNTNSTSFFGYSRYEELGDKKRWIRKRRQNYFGSTMHFYRSLTAGKLREEGFSVSDMRKPPTPATPADKAEKDSVNRYYEVRLKGAEILITDSAAGKYYISWANSILVRYNKTPHSRYYLEKKVLVRGLNPLGFTSYITLLANKVEIDKKGIVHAPLYVVYDGFWVYEKLANQLPFDYTPD